VFFVGHILRNFFGVFFIVGFILSFTIPYDDFSTLNWSPLGLKTFFGEFIRLYHFVRAYLFAII